ncbi:MAG: hypothetical protein NC548_38130 [Lachnospiraceae bacterium]|nr:hypothetical protein [Lachnospiraceae bacterium]
MKKKDMIDKLFRPETTDLSDILTIEVPIIADAAYNTDILQSNNLDDLEQGIRQAKKTGDFAWYVIAVSLAKIIDGGLYIQAKMTQKEYKEHIQARLGLDNRRVSDFLQAGRFLIDHGQKLINLGWRPEGMQVKIRLANSAKKAIKNETKLLEAIMHESNAGFRALISQKKYKKKSPMSSSISQKDSKLYLDGKEFLSVAPNLPADLAQDIQMIFEALIESRANKGRIACFAVDTRRQAQNAPRIFHDFIRGKFKKA